MYGRGKIDLLQARVIGLEESPHRICVRAPEAPTLPAVVYV